MSNQDPNMMTSKMFSFVRAHWYVSIKVVALYIILYLCTYAFNDSSSVLMGISIVSLFGWMFFDYQDTYRKAMRDVNLVKYKYIEYDPWKGLKSGLLAQIPGVVMVLLIFLTRNVTGAGESSVNVNDLFRLIYFILYSPVAMFVSNYIETAPFVLLLPMVIIPVTAHFGYYCGYRSIGFMHKLIYKQDKRKNRKRW